MFCFGTYSSLIYCNMLSWVALCCLSTGNLNKKTEKKGEKRQQCLWCRMDESAYRSRGYVAIAWRLPDVLGGVPPLRGQLPALRVIDRGVQDGDAHISVLEREQNTPYNIRHEDTKALNLNHYINVPLA